MNKEQLKKDIEQVNDGLKNFQRATVDHIFDLFTKEGRRRVLVADEVGLGKTVIARGTLAKLAEHSLLTNNEKTFKAIYFCSNSAILDQNLRKLQITKEKSDAAVSYRLSMLSLQLWKLDKEPAGDGEKLIRLIPLTPNTSLKVSASFGKDSERKLIFTVLQNAAGSDQELSDCIDLLKDILSRKSNGETIKGWDAMCEKTAPDSRGSDDETTEDGESEDEVEIDDQTDDEVTAEDGVSGDDGVFKPYTEDEDYINATAKEVLTALEKTSLPGEIKQLNSEIKDRSDGAVEGLFKNKETKARIKKIVGGLRHIFASISLKNLNADLIIMDEFQRFKDLLYAPPDTEVGMLMEKFKGSKTNILLLSATPYKPFVSNDGVDDSGESEEKESSDTSKKELEDLMRFLTEDFKKSQFGCVLLKDIRRKMLSPRQRRRCIFRTSPGSGVSEDDFKKVWKEHTAALNELARSRAPEIYKKAKATAAKASRMLSGYICRTERLSAKGSGSLFGNDIIPDIIPEKAEVTLFLKSLELPLPNNKKPKPELVRSSPYILSFAQGDYEFKKKLKEDYPTDDVFWLKSSVLDAKEPIPPDNAKLAELIKTVLPGNAEKLLWLPPSRPYYRPEGEFAGYYDDSGKLIPENAPTKTLVFSRYRIVPRMIAAMVSYEAERRCSFAKKAELRLNESGYSNGFFSLLYPCIALKGLYGPEKYPMNSTLADIRKRVRAKVEGLINERLPHLEYSDEPSNKAYILAMLRLDERENRSEYYNEWIKQFPKAGNNSTSKYSRDDLEKDLEKIEAAGGKLTAPKDLIDKLTDIAIASPAVCFGRMLERCGGTGSAAARELANGFLNQMYSNPLARAILDKEGKFWQHLLTYSAEGGLQAMLDEYCHILSEGCQKDKMADNVKDGMLEGMKYRGSTVTVDVLGDDKKIGEKTMYLNYAASITDKESKDEETGSNTLANKLKAFNSPFRPFVLASTSIGQEGLDYHCYCRRIVHWNLSVNPIDLEQRDGRIDRFKSLAIRQNIAIGYGGCEISAGVWKTMFDLAVEKRKRELGENSADLIPFWALQDDDIKVRIERIFPMLYHGKDERISLSKDENIYKRVTALVTIYRVTMGQPNQEELLKGLLKCDKDELKQLFIDLSPFNKPPKT